MLYITAGEHGLIQTLWQKTLRDSRPTSRSLEMEILRIQGRLLPDCRKDTWSMEESWSCFRSSCYGSTDLLGIVIAFPVLDVQRKGPFCVCIQTRDWAGSTDHTAGLNGELQLPRNCGRDHRPARRQRFWSIPWGGEWCPRGPAISWITRKLKTMCSV